MKDITYLLIDEDMLIERKEIILVHLHLHGILFNSAVLFLFTRVLLLSRGSIPAVPNPIRRISALGEDVTAPNSC